MSPAPKQARIPIDLAQVREKVLGQFRNLDTQNPWTWPALPRLALFLTVITGVVVVLWFLWLTHAEEELAIEQAKELALRDEYKIKLVKAVNLEELKKQREQVLQYVTQLEKQLPSKAEMDALLSDINQAGLGRGLSFDLFRPGQVLVRDYYAELPIAVKVTGRFHDMGAFAADIANLSRIVTLNNLVIVQARDSNNLTLDATAKTFRYLDPEEVLAQRKATQGAKK
jgi:type IV pilus assembly protein PilO